MKKKQHLITQAFEHYESEGDRRPDCRQWYGQWQRWSAGNAVPIADSRAMGATTLQHQAPVEGILTQVATLSSSKETFVFFATECTDSREFIKKIRANPWLKC